MQHDEYKGGIPCRHQQSRVSRQSSEIISLQTSTTQIDLDHSIDETQIQITRIQSNLTMPLVSIVSLRQVQQGKKKKLIQKIIKKKKKIQTSISYINTKRPWHQRTSLSHQTSYREDEVPHHEHCYCSHSNALPSPLHQCIQALLPPTKT